LRQFLFLVAMSLGAAFSQSAMAAGDLVPCEKIGISLKIDGFDPYAARCQQGDAGGNVGLRYEGLTADSGGILIQAVARRAVGDSYRKSISDAEVQRLAQGSNGWLAIQARSWSAPNRIGEGRIIQALTTNDVCLFYVEPFGNKDYGHRGDHTLLYCRPGTEFLGNEDIAYVLRGVAFKE